jgi:hypothetical protein
MNVTQIRAIFIDSISAVYTVDANQIKSKKQFNFLIQMISNKKTKIVATLGPHVVQKR